MNFHQYYPVDVVNGEGTRCTLFVAGCEHQCRGCYNQSTWSLNSGQVFDKQMEDRVITDLNDTRIKRRGLSLSGGDPLHPANVPAVLALVKRVRAECEGKDVWLWSGYELANLTQEQQAVIDLVDVLIDGKYEKELASPSLPWRGSANQVIHRLTLV
ncbi:anaerobic ribonucleoside-triphosphate reductase-activating protein [Enterovibrio norvegicus]|uniref:anaerobic ribonucleoside-triphosphate reductase-activating protein n=1 Tax=Enterovibrio norvegicus TaxID=188144 RepID=UPI000C85A607|nr:anaerobic ribonucleoside-triphosphate reductase-activating protein [Enterovibrio norvegicus]PMN62065.1 anaerobic ribonucleotide reductase-activating protein [Enterovibrio norvegicus]